MEKYIEVILPPLNVGPYPLVPAIFESKRPVSLVPACDLFMRYSNGHCLDQEVAGNDGRTVIREPLNQMEVISVTAKEMRAVVSLKFARPSDVLPPSNAPSR